MKKSLWLIVFMLLAGCASGPKYVASKDPMPGHALVYIYRLSDFTNIAVTPEIIINKKQYQSIVNGGYIFSYLKEGEYKIGLNFGETIGTSTYVFESGKTYYLKTFTGQRPIEYPYTIMYFYIEDVESEIGSQEITQTSLIGELKL